MNNRRQLVTSAAALALTALIGLAGCQSTQHSSGAMGMMNTKCPLSGEALPANCPSADYQGGKVGFCCNGCADKWNAMTDAQKAEHFARSK